MFHISRAQLDVVRRHLAGRILSLARVHHDGYAVPVGLRLLLGSDPSDPASWIVNQQQKEPLRGNGALVEAWVNDPSRVTEHVVERVLRLKFGVRVAP